MNWRRVSLCLLITEVTEEHTWARGSLSAIFEEPRLQWLLNLERFRHFCSTVVPYGQSGLTVMRSLRTASDFQLFMTFFDEVNAFLLSAFRLFLGFSGGTSSRVLLLSRFALFVSYLSGLTLCLGRRDT